MTEIDINELIEQIGIPFSRISDEEIKDCVANKIFLATHCIYNGNTFQYHTKTYNLLRIATIVNEIQNDTTILLTFGMILKMIYITYGNGEHHIRAFHYCKRNIYMSVNRSG